MDCYQSSTGKTIKNAVVFLTLTLFFLYMFVLLQDTVGFNLAGLRFIQNEMEAKQETFFADATEKVKKIRKKQKSAIVQVVK